MSDYLYQAQATRDFGIEFRSKLEAQWAYAFDHIKGALWDYTDGAWHDFSLDLEDAILPVNPLIRQVLIEIKPVGEKFLGAAVKRIPVGQSLIIIQGEPEFIAENGWSISCSSVTAAHRGSKEEVSLVRHSGSAFFVAQCLHDLHCRSRGIGTKPFGRSVDECVPDDRWSD